MEQGFGISRAALVLTVLSNGERGTAIALPSLNARSDIQEEDIVFLQNHTRHRCLLHRLDGVDTETHTGRMPAQFHARVDQHFFGKLDRVLFHHTRLNERRDLLNRLAGFLTRQQHAVDGKGRPDSLGRNSSRRNHLVHLRYPAQPDATPIRVDYEKIASETSPHRESGKRQIENVLGQPHVSREWSATASGFIPIPSAKEALNADIGTRKSALPVMFR